MQGLLKKGYDLNYAQSRAPSIIDAQGQQSSVSRNLSFRKVSPRDCFQSSKELHLHFEEDHESPSTQSTGQSCPEEGTLETKGYGNSAVSIKPSYCGTNVKSEEDQSKSTITFQDNGLSFSSIDYRQHASVPCAYPDPYQLGIFATYGHFPVVQVASEMMGMVPARALLPPDAPQDDPIYVNAKQIRAILRRRESRAKLEAQNKLPRARKPYLHESRHRHALKRARGSGGRFLNTKKKLHESSKDMDEPNAQDISSPFQLRLRTATAAGSEAQKEGISISTTSSTSTCVASSIENLFHSQDFRFSHL